MIASEVRLIPAFKLDSLRFIIILLMTVRTVVLLISFATYLIYAVNSNELNEYEFGAPEQYSGEDFTIGEDLAQKYIQEMGLDKPGTISIERYKEFLMKLFSKGEKVQKEEEQFYNELITKLSKDVPSEFDAQDLGKYVDQEKFMSTLDELIKGKYGEEVLNDFKNSTKKGEKKTDL